MPLKPGFVLRNRYRIESVLGQGGMGAVYKSVDVNLGVTVAVKENLFTTEEFARQFRREATILASLRHPNLPRVTDHFVVEGEGQYLVMDFVQGDDLRQRLERNGPVREDEALPWFLDTADALAYLHTRTPPVLHRDVKPGNIKITPEGRAVLVDFGLAKVVEEDSATTTGAKAMTPGFSPPEQYGSGRTDARTDIYSLGATLYAALTAAIPEDSLERAMGPRRVDPRAQAELERQRRAGAGGREGAGRQARGSLPIDGRAGLRPRCEHHGQPADGRAQLPVSGTDAGGGGEDGPVGPRDRRAGARPSSPTLASGPAWRGHGWRHTRRCSLRVVRRAREAPGDGIAVCPRSNRARIPARCLGYRSGLGADRHRLAPGHRIGQPFTGGTAYTHRSSGRPDADGRGDRPGGLCLDARRTASDLPGQCRWDRSQAIDNHDRRRMPAVVVAGWAAPGIHLSMPRR